VQLYELEAALHIVDSISGGEKNLVSFSYPTTAAGMSSD
jgi:hypothetical protein